jgi:hypothetical protein
MADPKGRRGAELVRPRTAPAAVRRRKSAAVRRRRNPHTAVPAVCAAACLAGGAAAHGRVPVWAVVVAAVVAVAAVDVAVSRRRLTATDRGSLRLGGVAAAAVVVAAATGTMTLRLLLLVAAVTGIATVRIARHPVLRAAIARRSYLEGLAQGWADVAEAIGQPHLRLNGPVIDRGHGHTYRVCVPKGMTIDFLKRMDAQLTSALGRRRGEVRVELDREWHTLAYIHVREGDPHATLTADVLDPKIESCTDRLPIARYEDDGSLLYLWLFHPEIGALHTLLAGSTGWGKSSLLIRILKLLVRARHGNVALWVGDGAQGKDLSAWKGCFDQYTQDPKRLLGMVRMLSKEIDRRGQVIAERGWSVWRPSRQDPAVLLIIDESRWFADSTYGPLIAAAIADIVSRGRACMVGAFIATQYPNGRNILGLPVRKESSNRVCTHTNEPDSFVLSKGQNTKHGLKTPGDIFAELVGEERDLPAHVIWTSEEDRATTIAEWGGKQAFGVCWEIAQEMAQEGKQEPADVQTSPDGQKVVEGEVLTVRPNVQFHPVYDAPKRRAEMDWDEANEVFRAMLNQAGPDGVTRRQVEEKTGWKRTRVRDQLITPAMDAGWVAYETRGREHFYVLARESTS